MKEKYIYGAKLVGKYGFPEIPYTDIPGSVSNLHPVEFQNFNRDKNPKSGLLHCFVDDFNFSRLWENCDKYINALKNYAAVCSTDFSASPDMPLAMQIWNVYRDRTMAYYLWLNGVNVIPTAGWIGPHSYEWCWDGLPKHSIVSISTNGCYDHDGQKWFVDGAEHMSAFLEPQKIIVVGRPIEFRTNAKVYYFESNGQKAWDRYGKIR